MDVLANQSSAMSNIASGSYIAKASCLTPASCRASASFLSRPPMQSVIDVPPIVTRRSALLLALLGLPSKNARAATLPVNAKPVRIFDLMSTVAGPGGLQGPASAQLGRLATSLSQLNLLIGELGAADFKANEDDGMIVLRISAIYFKSTPDLMRLSTELMPLLEPEDANEAARLSDAFEEATSTLEQGCRTQDYSLQLKSAQQGSRALTTFLKLASTRYTVPEVQMPYSSFRP